MRGRIIQGLRATWALIAHGTLLFLNVRPLTEGGTPPGGAMRLFASAEGLARSGGQARGRMVSLASPPTAGVLPRLDRRRQGADETTGLVNAAGACVAGVLDTGESREHPSCSGGRT